ncbi:MAG: phosphoglycerate mutase family protein [Firmicutes bacterium]|nr:phosphoglycerate mutase family protein [Bacillota bacterium]
MATVQTFWVMRHGRPDLPRNPLFMTRNEFNQYLAAYDEAALSVHEQDRLQRLYAAYPKVDLVIASDLPRALETAKLFARHDNIIVDSLFREIPVWLPNDSTLFLKQRWPGEFWWSYLRFHWFWDQEPEGRTRSTERAREAISRLEQYQKQGPRLAVVSHAGFLLLLINLLQQDRRVSGRRLPHIGFGLPTLYRWR